MSKQIPKILFHGSTFLSKTLMNSYDITGELRKWDETESNRFLYATTDKDEAVRQAIYSSLERIHGATRFKTEADESGVLFVTVTGPLTQSQLEQAVAQTSVYLYQITTNKFHDWKLVNNLVNSLQDEWKTRQHIPNMDFTVKKIHGRDLLDSTRFIAACDQVNSM